MLELARESDYDAVKAIARQVHDLHVCWRPDLFCQEENPIPKDFFLECIQNRSLFVAKLSGTVVGFLRFDMWENGGPGNVKRKCMRIDNIAVEEQFRRCGIGRVMLEDARALARAYGCDEIILSVYPQNDAAVNFYQKCGFSIRTIGMDMKL